MNRYDWNWKVVGDYLPAFINGAVVTILLTIIVIFVGTVLGTAFGVVLADKRPVLRPLRWLVVAYVELLRALPVLVLLIWMHYVAPQTTTWMYNILGSIHDMLSSNIGERGEAILRGITSRAFATASVALSLNLSAFVADIVRSGIANVPTPLVDAAKSLGMCRWTCLRRVILPEALRASVAAMVAMYITMFKFTTLAAFIGCSELLNTVFTAGNSSYRYLELYTMLAVVYLAILLPSTYFAKRLEQSKWLQRRT